MKCTNCGEEISQGVSFCTNCGMPVEASQTKPSVGTGFDGLGDSLESAVSANAQAMGPIEERTQSVIEAAQQSAQQAEEAVAQASEQPADAAATAATAAAAAAGAAAAPFYQQDVSPNAHFSSQRSYEQNAYGQTVNQGQPAYQEPSYGQNPAGYQQPSYGQEAAPQQAWPAQSATKRAFAMVLYVSGLLGLIFALVVRDKDDEFLTYHLNNVAVIFIGVIIATVLSAIIIGMLLWIYLIVMTIMGIISAYNGDMRELPLISKIKIVK